MLTIADRPIIQNAITKRLDQESGVRIGEVSVWPGDRAICVKVQATVGNYLAVESRFDLPPQFEIGHLYNEIDEMAEQYKVARADFWRRGQFIASPRRQVAGTGLRGRWHAD